MTICPRCEAVWGGLKTGHCSACHRTFTSITSFDKHRTGSHPASTRHCLDPEKAGLVLTDRPYPCWGLPGQNPEYTQDDTGPDEIEKEGGK